MSLVLSILPYLPFHKENIASALVMQQQMPDFLLYILATLLR